MIKLSQDLIPGDVINIGGGQQMISIIAPFADKLAVLCACGQALALPYNCDVYVYCNRDEELSRAAEVKRQQAEHARRQAELERQIREARNQALLRRAREAALLEHGTGHTPSIRLVNGERDGIREVRYR